MPKAKVAVTTTLIEEAARRAARQRGNTKTLDEITRTIEQAAQRGTAHMFGLVKAALA